MKKLLIGAGLLCLLAVGSVSAQNRKAVNAAEVNGTFRSYFGGKFKGSYNEVKILSLGKGRLRVAFQLVYPYVDGAGEMTANVGTADGTALIKGDTAVYSPDGGEQCVINIKFVKRGAIEITQSETSSDCGFGHNVTADGNYRKASGAKPKFDIE